MRHIKRKLLGSAICIVLSVSQAFAAIAYVDLKDGYNAAGSGAPIAVAAAAMNVTGGNCLLVLTSGQGTTVNITDTALNSFTQAGTRYNPASTNQQSAFYSCSVTGNAADIVTATWPGGSGGDEVIAVFQFSGMATSSIYVTQATANGNSSSPQTAAIAPTNATGVIVEWIANTSSGGGFANNSGFVVTANSGRTCCFAAGYKIVSGSTTPIATQNSGLWEMSAEVFNGPATANTNKLPLYMNSIP